AGRRDIAALGATATRREARQRHRAAREAATQPLAQARGEPGSWKDRELAARPALLAPFARGRAALGHRRNAAPRAQRVPPGGFAHAPAADIARASAGPGSAEAAPSPPRAEPRRPSAQLDAEAQRLDASPLAAWPPPHPGEVGERDPCPHAPDAPEDEDGKAAEQPRDRGCPALRGEHGRAEQANPIALFARALIRFKKSMLALGDEDEIILTVATATARAAFGGGDGPHAETDDSFAGASASEAPSRGAAVLHAALHHPDAPDARLDSTSDVARAMEVGDASLPKRTPLRFDAPHPFAPSLGAATANDAADGEAEESGPR
ncbi:unnamed protein product, partial [Prorocentrum cordatum]